MPPIGARLAGFAHASPRAGRRSRGATFQDLPWRCRRPSSSDDPRAADAATFPTVSHRLTVRGLLFGRRAVSARWSSSPRRPDSGPVPRPPRGTAAAYVAPSATIGPWTLSLLLRDFNLKRLTKSLRSILPKRFTPSRAGDPAMEADCLDHSPAALVMLTRKRSRRRW